MNTRRIWVCLLALMLALGGLSFAQAEEKPVLRVLTEYSQIDLNENPTAKLLEELTGYKVQYDALPNEERLPKLNAILAAREPYDIMILAPDSFANTIHLGAYTQLDDLLAAKGQAVLDGTNPTLWTSTTIDGKVMGIPYRLSTENYNSGLRVRTDLLASVGITELPATPDALYEALSKVKSELGIVPLTGVSSGANVFIDEIASAFGLYSNWLVTESGITHRGVAPGAKAYVTFMNKLYTEGLLDSEWPQNTGDTAREKFLSGKALMNRVYWWEEPSASETLTANFTDAAFAYLPPLTGEVGAGMSVNRSNDKVVVIPRAAANPEAAMDWINLKVSTPEIFRELCIGTEGTHYSVLENGEYAPINPAFTDDKGYANEYLTSTIAADYDTYWSQTRVRKNETLYQEFTKMQENVGTAKIYYDPTSFMSPDATFSELAPTVNAFVYDGLLQMIAGTRPLEDWDTFVQEYYDAGGEELETLLNAWWSANQAELADKISR